MNKIPKYSIILIAPIIFYASYDYIRQIIREEKFKENSFLLSNDPFSEIELYRAIAVLDQWLFVLSFGFAQLIHSKNLISKN